MVEFDLPGHIAGPLCAAEPSLCVANKCAPDPSSEHWWTWLDNVVAELTEIFPRDTFMVEQTNSTHRELLDRDSYLVFVVSEIQVLDLGVSI